MASHRDAIFVNKVYVEKAPLPSDVPHVSEIGATSAALETAAFFIGAHCKEVNEDFMLCKKESADPAHCLKEGRRVTRCAQDLWVGATRDREEHVFFRLCSWLGEVNTKTGTES
jgi:NADH dehydrogenase (ubiquinone) 1 alpha subcomplex subunit 8